MSRYGLSYPVCSRPLPLIFSALRITIPFAPFCEPSTRPSGSGEAFCERLPYFFYVFSPPPLFLSIFQCHRPTPTPPTSLSRYSPFSPLHPCVKGPMRLNKTGCLNTSPFGPSFCAGRFFAPALSAFLRLTNTMSRTYFVCATHLLVLVVCRGCLDETNRWLPFLATVHEGGPQGRATGSLRGFFPVGGQSLFVFFFFFAWLVRPSNSVWSPKPRPGAFPLPDFFRNRLLDPFYATPPCPG